ncbi:G-protein alpha subunit [Mycena sanguinolenta]|nr:G-protein alpha subunit [Mycena sanguinolenta]
MGASSSRSSKAHTSAIDGKLEAESRQIKSEASVLLLGSDEAGKSALVKHMKLLQGFTPDELAAFRSAIHRTVIDSAQAIVSALRTSGLDGMLTEEQRHLPDEILRTKPDDALNTELVNAINALWRTPAVVRALDDEELNLPNTVLLTGSHGSFFSEIQRLAQPGYIPTEQDVVCMPGRTNSISETRLTMGLLSIRLIDVGPQRSERKRWIRCFESVTSIIFCTALSDYDQIRTEERGQSLVLFSSIINSRWFLRTSIILFLTEIDVFEAKISKIPLSAHFPEYIGGSDINKAAKFDLWRFMQENRARLNVYPHITGTNDTKSIWYDRDSRSPTAVSSIREAVDLTSKIPALELTAIRREPDDTLDPDLANAIEALWRTPAVVRVLDDEHDRQLYLPDNASQ